MPATRWPGRVALVSAKWAGRGRAYARALQYAFHCRPVI